MYYKECCGKKSSKSTIKRKLLGELSSLGVGGNLSQRYKFRNIIKVKTNSKISCPALFGPLRVKFD